MAHTIVLSSNELALLETIFDQWENEYGRPFPAEKEQMFMRIKAKLGIEL